MLGTATIGGTYNLNPRIVACDHDQLAATGLTQRTNVPHLAVEHEATRVQTHGLESSPGHTAQERPIARVISAEHGRHAVEVAAEEQVGAAVQPASAGMATMQSPLSLQKKRCSGPCTEPLRLSHTGVQTVSCG